MAPPDISNRESFTVTVLDATGETPMGTGYLRLARENPIAGEYRGRLDPIQPLKEGEYTLQFAHGKRWLVWLKPSSPHGRMTVTSDLWPPE